MVDLLGRPARAVRVPPPATASPTASTITLAADRRSRIVPGVHPGLELPEHVEEKVTSILFGRGVSVDPDTELRVLASQHPQHAAAIARLAQLLRDQVEDMQRRLGAVWRLSRSEGRYEVLEELGRGGLGTVSIVRDRLLGRRVAQKMIHPRHGTRLHDIDPAKVHRFLDEAQIAAQLQHPGIPAVHDLGIGPMGVPYYTMRYVRGVTLEKWLEPGDGTSRSMAEVAEVLVHIARAVSHAHERQVVHRDLKPANVLVGRFGEVCVIDWGLARALPGGSRLGESPEVRVDRRVDLFSHGLGSQGYIAPEQEAGECHAASDVFSLGAILHRAMVGMPPIQRKGQTRYDVPRVARQLDRRLAAICAHSVAPRLEDRYPSMASMLEDLRSFLADRMPAACRASVWDHVQLFCRRLRRRRKPAPGIPWLRATLHRRSQNSPPDVAPAAPAPAQFTVATIFPAGRDEALGGAGGGAVGGRRGRAAFLDQRLDAIRRLSTPLERFRQKETLGEGGMALVLGMEDGLLRRSVAVKLLRSTLHGREFSARMLDEAQIAAQLDHPAILTVHELGVDAEGHVRMVMPLVAGGRFDQFLQQRPGEWRAGAELLLQVAWGLAFAHRKGVVHRDVKPSNIVLGLHGDAYLADWGVALLVGAPGEGETRVRLHRGADVDREVAEENVTEEAGGAGLVDATVALHHPSQPGAVIVGTPAYMAPECFTGAAIGPHSDVWALGLVLRECLTGRHPYSDRLQLEGMQGLQRILAEPIASVRRQTPRALRPLADVTDRALQGNPAERYRDAAEFAQALFTALRALDQ